MADEDETNGAEETAGEDGSRQPDASAEELEAIYGITVDVTAVLGTATLKVSQLLRLGRGAVVQLDRKVEEEIELFVNGVMFAKGEVTVSENHLSARLTKIVKSGIGKS